MKSRKSPLLLWRVVPFLAVLALMVVTLPSYNGTPTAGAAGNNGSSPAGVLTADVVAQVAVTVNGPWQEFSFGSTAVDAAGCFPVDPAGTGCVPSSGGNSVFAGPPAWKFTAPPGGATLVVADAFCRGDRFNVKDFSVSIGTTSAVAVGACGSDDPDITSADPTFSSAAIALAPGNHSITIRPTVSPFGGGAAYFRLTSTCTESPIDPSSVSPLIFPGESTDVGKCITLPPNPAFAPSATGASAAGSDNGNSGTPGASAQAAVPVGGTTWSEFRFTDTSTDATACPFCTPSSGGNSQDAGDPPWTFVAPPIGAVLFVTDAFCKGDEFEVFDFGSSIGTTSAVATEAGCAGVSDPTIAIADPEYSSGGFVMAPGPHSITIRPTESPFLGGAAYFIIQEVPVAKEHKKITVPEGFLTGGGQINDGAKGKNQKKISFGGNVGFLGDGSLIGHWNTILHNVGGTSLDNAKFHSTSIESLQFANDGGAGPNPPPANANVAQFTAVGRLKIGNGIWVNGYRLTVCLADRGEPGSNDSIRLILTDPGGTVVYTSSTSDNFGQPSTAGGCVTNKLDSGNLQIHSGLKS